MDRTRIMQLDLRLISGNGSIIKGSGLGRAHPPWHWVVGIWDLMLNIE